MGHIRGESPLIPTRHTSGVPTSLPYSEDFNPIFSDTESRTHRWETERLECEITFDGITLGVPSGCPTFWLRRLVVNRSLTPDGCWYTHWGLSKRSGSVRDSIAVGVDCRIDVGLFLWDPVLVSLVSMGLRTRSPWNNLLFINKIRRFKPRYTIYRYLLCTSIIKERKPCWSFIGNIRGCSLVETDWWDVISTVSILLHPVQTLSHSKFNRTVTYQFSGWLTVWLCYGGTRTDDL